MFPVLSRKRTFDDRFVSSLIRTLSFPILILVFIKKKRGKRPAPSTDDSTAGPSTAESGGPTKKPKTEKVLSTPTRFDSTYVQLRS